MKCAAVEVPSPRRAPRRTHRARAARSRWPSKINARYARDKRCPASDRRRARPSGPLLSGGGQSGQRKGRSARGASSVTSPSRRSVSASAVPSKGKPPGAVSAWPYRSGLAPRAGEVRLQPRGGRGCSRLSQPESRGVIWRTSPRRRRILRRQRKVIAARRKTAHSPNMPVCPPVPSTRSQKPSSTALGRSARRQVQRHSRAQPRHVRASNRAHRGSCWPHSSTCAASARRETSTQLRRVCVSVRG